jgi:hypothetical protein
VIAPLLVGLLVWLAAPNRAGSAPRAMIGGYPTALGFFVAFVIVLVTVPVLKIASLVRRWTDEHVYIQPHDHQYDAVIHALAEASESPPTPDAGLWGEFRPFRFDVGTAGNRHDRT